MSIEFFFCQFVKHKEKTGTEPNECWAVGDFPVVLRCRYQARKFNFASSFYYYFFIFIFTRRVLRHNQNAEGFWPCPFPISKPSAVFWNITIVIITITLKKKGGGIRRKVVKWE